MGAGFFIYLTKSVAFWYLKDKFEKLFLMLKYKMYYMETSEPKKVNSIYNIIIINLLRLGGLHIELQS